MDLMVQGWWFFSGFFEKSCHVVLWGKRIFFENGCKYTKVDFFFWLFFEKSCHDVLWGKRTNFENGCKYTKVDFFSDFFLKKVGILYFWSNLPFISLEVNYITKETSYGPLDTIFEKSKNHVFLMKFTIYICAKIYFVMYFLTKFSLVISQLRCFWHKDVKNFQEVFILPPFKTT